MSEHRQSRCSDIESLQAVFRWEHQFLVKWRFWPLQSQKRSFLRPENDIGSGFQPLLGDVHAAACGLQSKGLRAFRCIPGVCRQSDSLENKLFFLCAQNSGEAGCRDHLFRLRCGARKNGFVQTTKCPVQMALDRARRGKGGALPVLSPILQGEKWRGARPGSARRMGERLSCGTARRGRRYTAGNECRYRYAGYPTPGRRNCWF